VQEDKLHRVSAMFFKQPEESNKTSIIQALVNGHSKVVDCIKLGHKSRKLLQLTPKSLHFNDLDTSRLICCLKLTLNFAQSKQMFMTWNNDHHD
jgi:hypothetical protein